MTTQTQRNRLRRRATGDPEDADYAPLASPVLPIAQPCGAVKVLRGVTLRCTREAGHLGDHGQHQDGQLVIRWSQ